MKYRIARKIYRKMGYGYKINNLGRLEEACRVYKKRITVGSKTFSLKEYKKSFKHRIPKVSKNRLSKLCSQFRKRHKGLNYEYKENSSHFVVDTAALAKALQEYKKSRLTGSIEHKPTMEISMNLCDVVCKHEEFPKIENTILLEKVQPSDTLNEKTIVQTLVNNEIETTFAPRIMEAPNGNHIILSIDLIRNINPCTQQSAKKIYKCTKK